MDKFRNTYRIESARLKGWNYGWDAFYFVTICTGERKCFFGEIDNVTMKYTAVGEIANQLWQEIPHQFDYAELDEYIVMPNHIHGIIRINKTKLKQKPNGNDLSAKGMGNGCDGDNCRDGTTGDGYDGDNCTDGATGDGRDAINRVSTVAQTADVPLINEPTTDVPLINETTDVPLINAPSTDIPIFHDNISNGPPTRNSITNKQGGITGNNNPMLYDNLSRIIRWYKGRVTFETRKILTGFSWQSRFHDRIIHNEEQLARVRQYIINNPQNWDNDKLKLK
jgi:putative transposase